MAAKKLTKKDVDTYNILLMEKRNFLTGTMEEKQGQNGTSGGDEADMGSDSYEQDLTFSLLQNEGDVVQKIDDALGRLRDGTFGTCLICDEQIAKARLKAIPWTPYCIECQRKEEAC